MLKSNEPTDRGVHTASALATVERAEAALDCAAPPGQERPFAKAAPRFHGRLG